MDLMKQHKLRLLDDVIISLPAYVLTRFGVLNSMLLMLDGDSSAASDEAIALNVSSKTFNLVLDWFRACDRDRDGTQKSANIFLKAKSVPELIELIDAADFLEVPDLLKKSSLAVQTPMSSCGLWKVLFCFNCRKVKSEDIDLKKCSRCSLAKYCSVDCQREDWSKHKTVCKKIKALNDQVDKLRNRPADNNDMVFIKHDVDMSMFLGELAYTLLEWGLESKSFEMMELCAKYYERYMDAGFFDRNRVYLLLFILLNVDQDDKAYSYIKHFMTSDEEDDIFFKRSSLMRANIRENVLSQVQHHKFLALHEDKLGTGSGCGLAKKKMLKDLVIPMTNAELKRQRELVEICLDRIQKTSDICLQALVNPEPLESAKPDPDSPAFDVLQMIKYGGHLFHKETALMQSIVRRVGKTPSYKVKTGPIRVM